MKNPQTIVSSFSESSTTGYHVAGIPCSIFMLFFSVWYLVSLLCVPGMSLIFFFFALQRFVIFHYDHYPGKLISLLKSVTSQHRYYKPLIQKTSKTFVLVGLLFCSDHSFGSKRNLRERKLSERLYWTESGVRAFGTTERNM